jgi:hypothetical protein
LFLSVGAPLSFARGSRGRSFSNSIPKVIVVFRDLISEEIIKAMIVCWVIDSISEKIIDTMIVCWVSDSISEEIIKTLILCWVVLWLVLDPWWR